MDLTEILTPERLSEGEFAVTVPEDWMQGRGAFGGLVVGAMVRCVELSEPDRARTVRAVTCEICGPVKAGPARISVKPLRRGSAMSTIRATIHGEGEVLADLVAILGRQRPDAPVWQELPPPEMPAWEAVPVALIQPPLGPIFTPKMEFRVVSGPPFMGVGDKVVSGWIRIKDPGPERGAACLAALIDAWWPAGASRFEGPRPLATVAFTMEVVGSTDGLDPALPFFYTGCAPVSDEGYMVELRELRGADGRLLALNQQTIAIIK